MDLRRVGPAGDAFLSGWSLTKAFARSAGGDLNSRLSDSEPGVFTDLGQRSNAWVRTDFWCPSFSVLDHPIAPSSAMDD